MDAPPEPLDVLESAQWIVSQATSVTVPAAGVAAAAAQLQALGDEAFALSLWRTCEQNPRVVTDDTLEWIFVVDTLNFCFWAERDAPLFACLHEGRTFTGYWALCACVNRALAEGIPFTSAAYLADLTLAQLQHVFRSASAAPVPLLQQRLAVLREAGRVLLERFDGRFRVCVAQCGHSAVALVRLLVQNFSSYR